jgi:hypothetical protein
LTDTPPSGEPAAKTSAELTGTNMIEVLVALGLAAIAVVAIVWWVAPWVAQRHFTRPLPTRLRAGKLTGTRAFDTAVPCDPIAAKALRWMWRRPGPVAGAHYCEALLVMESEDPARAVRVEIGRRSVGYLAADRAASLLHTLATRPGRRVAVDAVVRGDAPSGAPRVWLDLGASPAG